MADWERIVKPDFCGAVCLAERRANSARRY